MKAKFIFTALLLTPLIATEALAAIQLNSQKPAQNYLFEGDPKALASSVQLVFRTGSLADPRGKEGLAMLSFHSLLRGTKSKSKDEFYRVLERLGASIDVDIGAGRTIVSLNALSENLEPAIQLLAEAVLTPSLKKEEIAAIKEEALASLNQELANNRRILKRIFRLALFHGTSLAFPPEGTINGTKALTPEDVRAFLAEQVKAGSAIFAVSTDRPEALVRAWLEKAFAALPEGSPPLPALPEPAPPHGRSVYVLNRKGSATTEISIGHLGIKANNKDRETLETGLFAFGEDMSSRLFKELREKKGWTYGAAAGFDLFERPRRYTGGFMVWAFPQAEHTEELVLRAIQLYEDYAKKGLTPKELDFSRKSLTNSYPFKFATSRSRLTSRLYELIESSPHYTVPEYRKILNGITPKSLRTAIKKAHDPENMVIVLVGDPERTSGLLKSIPKLKTVVTVTDPMAEL